MQAVTKQTLKIYWKHSVRYPGVLTFLVLLVIAVSVIDTYQPFVLKSFFNILAGTGGQRGEQALNLVFVMLGLALLTQLLWRVLEYVFNWFEPRVMSDLLNTCYEYLLGHSYSFFSNNFIGSMVTRVRRYQGAFEGIADTILYNLFQTGLRMTFIIIVMFVFWPMLGLFALVWMICYLSLTLVLAKYKLKFDLKKAAQETKTTAHLADTLTNNVNIKVFTGQKAEIRTFRQITNLLFLRRKQNWDVGNHINAFQGLALVLLEFVILFSGLKYWEQGRLTIGDFVLLQAYVGQIFNQLWDFGRNMRRIFEALGDANEMTEMLNEPYKVVDAPGAKPLAVTQGRIEFNKVGFFYEKENQIFKNFSLALEPGKKVAFVGASGAGKSTIVKLLLRFEDVKKGHIFIDGQDISKVTQDSLREAIAFVPQDPILFHRSLLDNIRYGRKNATEKEVVAAAKLAHAHEFISKFPDGYKTFVGERGVKLSGGERQRVAIARAILRDAPILILDEATSSLDSESEKLIQEALHNLMQGRTSIAIAHRLSTIRNADRIIVIDEGSIVEEGKHDELIKARTGLYQKLWEIQVSGFETAAN